MGTNIGVSSPPIYPVFPLREIPTVWEGGRYAMLQRNSNMGCCRESSCPAVYPRSFQVVLQGWQLTGVCSLRKHHQGIIYKLVTFVLKREVFLSEYAWCLQWANTFSQSQLHILDVMNFLVNKTHVNTALFFFFFWITFIIYFVYLLVLVSVI